MRPVDSVWQQRRCLVHCCPVTEEQHLLALAGKVEGVLEQQGCLPTAAQTGRNTATVDNTDGDIAVWVSQTPERVVTESTA